MSTPTFSPFLAPLQRVMLRDSLSAPAAGHHVEQVEIRFSKGVGEARVVSAWEETIARTEALRLAFVVVDGNPAGWESVEPLELLRSDGPVPASWEEWLETDRRHPLLFPAAVPWRAVLWPEEMRFVWTFHHALLDGRSIARILREFLKRVAGGAGESLAITRWQPAAEEMKSLGDAMFRRVFADLETPGSLPPGESSDDSPAVRHLGNAFFKTLESQSAENNVTPATLLIEAWGKTLLRRCGAESVVVEQVRSGAPQPGTAGFSMNLLPLRLGRGNLRQQLLDLRHIESLGAEDFSPGVFPHVSGPWNSVIMVEHGSLAHQTDVPDLVESITLHEHKGRALAATAHLLPDLRLEVEGPGRHELLGEWIDVLLAGAETTVRRC